MGDICILGQNGQVTRYLQSTLSKRGLAFQVITRDRLDLSDTDEIQPVLAQIQPSIIVNPAAYTAVDLAESEPNQADLINRVAVAEIANYCAKTKTPLIHFSTDYVFSGNADTAYLETDPASPNGVYGSSKYQGELAVLKSGAPALILRTSWVYSTHGKNFYKTMLALSETRDELSVVADQIGAPTYAGSIAEATFQLLDIIIKQGKIIEQQVGVYHFSCAGQTSWYEFAKAIFLQKGKSQIVVTPITTAEYPTPAKRPAFSVLDNSKLSLVFNIALPDWQDALSDCIAEQD